MIIPLYAEQAWEPKFVPHRNHCQGIGDLGVFSEYQHSSRGYQSCGHQPTLSVSVQPHQMVTIGPLYKLLLFVPMPLFEFWFLCLMCLSTVTKLSDVKNLRPQSETHTWMRMISAPASARPNAAA